MAEHDARNGDWGRIFAEAVAIASTLTGRDAEDLVQEAMTIYFEGGAPWDASGAGTLAQHLVQVGLNARRNKARTDRRRRHPKIINTLRRLFGGAPSTPEESLAEAREEQRKKELFEKLVADLADDPDARDIALLQEQGVTDVGEQAARIGRDIETVRNVRKRVGRRAEALAKKDREERAKKEEEALAKLDREALAKQDREALAKQDQEPKQGREALAKQDQEALAKQDREALGKARSRMKANP